MHEPKQDCGAAAGDAVKQRRIESAAGASAVPSLAGLVQAGSPFRLLSVLAQRGAPQNDHRLGDHFQQIHEGDQD